MKLQHIAIVFVIIILPITIIMSSYISNQIEAIEIQTAYDKNIISATYDAVKAFQINTTNNKYSSISDSKIRDIEAAVNTFYNSLNISMREYSQSAQDIETYTPALLFTLYDGYYIYSSYNNVYDTRYEGNDEKVSIDLNEKNYQSGLKPYVYYSAKYKLRNGNIIVVNYTLDNAITVYGDFGGNGENDGYVTKSGYLINPDYVTINPDYLRGDTSIENMTLMYGDPNKPSEQIEIAPETLTEHLITIQEQGDGTTTTAEGDYTYIFHQNSKIYQDYTVDANGNKLLLYYDSDGNVVTENQTNSGIPVIFWYQNYEKTYINDPAIREYARDCKMLSTSAFEYYYEAKIFSEWVREYLGDIDQDDTIRNEDGITTIGEARNSQTENGEEPEEYLSENTGDAKIFYADEENDPMLSGSAFNNHRLAVIRKSIETSLNTVISNFKSLMLYEYAMPVIAEDDWYRILNNVSMVAFMQGMSIGYRDYNNYAIVTNNVNKEVVKTENIYIVAKETEPNANNREYHQPGCKELISGFANGSLEVIGAYPTASFQRQTVKVSEGNEEHFYYQACEGDTLTGCYNCIVNATGDYDIDDIIAGDPLIDFDNREENGGNNEPTFSARNSGYQLLRKVYLTALARERYDLYKTNFDLSDLG